MIKEEIKISFLVISPPPFGGKHSTVKYSLFKLYNITVSYTSEHFKINKKGLMFLYKVLINC